MMANPGPVLVQDTSPALTVVNELVRIPHSCLLFFIAFFRLFLFEITDNVPTYTAIKIPSSPPIAHIFPGILRASYFIDSHHRPIHNQ